MKYVRGAKPHGVFWFVSLLIVTLVALAFAVERFTLADDASVASVPSGCQGQHVAPSCKAVNGIAKKKAMSPATHTPATDIKTPVQAGQTSPTPTATSSTAWQLVWNDEFNGAALDTAKWTALNGGKFYTPATSEYYAPDDTYTQNGLIMKSEQRSYNGFNYTSGGVSSQGKFSFLYGKVEWREQLPRGKGLWPAIWLMPADGSGRYEIDMLELVGNNPFSMYMNYHWQNADGHDHENMTRYAGPDFSADFHVFALQWTPDKMEWLVDGVVEKTITSNILNVPMFMYMNTAVGSNGTWPGLPDGATVFPQYTKISYVRVYKAA